MCFLYTLKKKVRKMEILQALNSLVKDNEVVAIIHRQSRLVNIFETFFFILKKIKIKWYQQRSDWKYYE